jgi:hypothetical protein
VDDDFKLTINLGESNMPGDIGLENTVLLSSIEWTPKPSSELNYDLTEFAEGGKIVKYTPFGIPFGNMHGVQLNLDDWMEFQGIHSKARKARLANYLDKYFEDFGYYHSDFKHGRSCWVIDARGLSFSNPNSEYIRVRLQDVADELKKKKSNEPKH